jgi:hypothetical protein
MANGPQADTVQGDEIDFQAAPQTAAGDGIDFQPAAQARELDFKPTAQPITFESIYKPQGGPSIREAAAQAPPLSLTQQFEPKTVDLTKIPRSPFTNQLEPRPPMLTEEEKAKLPTISAQPDVTLPGPHGVPIRLPQKQIEAMGNVFLPGADINENFTLQGNEPLVRKVDLGRGLIAPQNILPEEARREHPIFTGIGQLTEGLTTPENLAIMAGSMGIGDLPAAARSALSAYFAAQAAKGATDYGVQGWKAYERRDNQEAQRLWTLAAGGAVIGGVAGAHSIREAGLGPKIGPEPFVPAGTISRPLAIDESTTRGARRLQDFTANESARRGMGNLAEAERGIEAARQARINAPVQIPKTYEGEPAMLPARPIGPERNPLAVEAQQVREERTSREQPGFKVLDLRRVVPENPEEQPYYVLPDFQREPSKSLIETPSDVGIRGRSATMTQLAKRTVPGIEESLTRRYPPDVLEEARQELQSAAGLAGSFERPGRYFASVGQTDVPFHEDPRAGIRHGGAWYGVNSARPQIEAMHPWFKDITEGPETFARTVQNGKGAAYDRMLDRAAAHIQAERESARPVLEEYAPQLHTLAGQVRDVDPELSQTLLDIASGKAVGFHNLRGYIEEKLHDAQAAAIFSQAVDEAAREAGQPTGVEESSDLGGEARTAEGRGEEAPGKSIRAVAEGIDFQPLPEPQPINPMEVAELQETLGPGRVVTPERVNRILADRAVVQNIEQGLSGNRRDEVGEIREEHRSKLERQGREGVLPGMEGALEEQRQAAQREQGRQLTEEINRPPTSIEERAGHMERESPLFRGKGPQAELYSGIHPKAVAEGARMLQQAWENKVAQPFIDRIAKIGDKYQKAGEADPAVAEGLHLLDNAPQYLRAKAAQEVHNVIGDLSREQERLFVLMADASSRENLRTNHPEEYAAAQRDPAIQEALKAYRPLERQLTDLRQRMGGATIDDDYLRRVYDKYIAGVGHAEAPGTPERGTSAYDRVIRPQRIGNMGREAEAEYYYQNGLHEFGPSFATKYIATHLRALRDQVARGFMDKATFLPTDGSEPRFILYNGDRYYRPDVAREMRDAGDKNVKAYDRYDPTAGEKFPVPVEGKYLGPRDLVKALNDFGRREESEPGALRRFFQEQIIGFGFGIPHVANIMRRVSQSVPGGAVNPQGWARAWKVVLSKELRDRGIAGLNDPTFDMLAQRGAISTGEWSNLKEYWGGNLNPANWARSLAKVGHKLLFEPESAGGFGGIDQRARIYIADLVKSQRPELSDTEIARVVRDQLGDYNRSNWSDQQKLIAKFMMFPGWDVSSARWVLQHPIKTTVPPALLVLLANQALHHFGQNRPEDQYDIQNIHVGDRAYGATLLRESVARNLFRPVLEYAQAKVRGESERRAMAEASHGITAGAGGLLSMLRPDLSGFLALATNRQGLFSSKEIVSKDDYQRPGQVLPSRAIEKQAVFALRQAIPSLGRMLDADQEFDLRAFAGGNLGAPNFRDDAEKRLIRNAAEAQEIHSTISKLAKSNQELAREYVKDPDNAAYALFFHDLETLAGTLKRMGEAKERIEASGLPEADKQRKIETIEKNRENLLRHADGLNNLLFERAQKGKQPVIQLPSGLFPAAAPSGIRAPAGANQ